jgi:hypothetical protein
MQAKKKAAKRGVLPLTDRRIGKVRIPIGVCFSFTPGSFAWTATLDQWSKSKPLRRQTKRFGVGRFGYEAGFRLAVKEAAAQRGLRVPSPLVVPPIPKVMRETPPGRVVAPDAPLCLSNRKFRGTKLYVGVSLKREGDQWYWMSLNKIKGETIGKRFSVNGLGWAAAYRGAVLHSTKVRGGSAVHVVIKVPPKPADAPHQGLCGKSKVKIHARKRVIGGTLLFPGVSHSVEKGTPVWRSRRSSKGATSFSIPRNGWRGGYILAVKHQAGLLGVAVPRQIRVPPRPRDLRV